MRHFETLALFLLFFYFAHLALNKEAHWPHSALNFADPAILVPRGYSLKIKAYCNLHQRQQQQWRYRELKNRFSAELQSAISITAAAQHL